MNLPSIDSEEALPPDSWFAGLFDGEGCVVFVKRHSQCGSTSYHLELNVGNTNGRVVRLFSVKFGGHVQVNQRNTLGRKRKFYIWRVAGTAARRALTTLCPLLVVKRHEANFALEYYTLPWRGSGGLRTRVQQEIDQRYYDTIKELKRWEVRYWWESPIANKPQVA